MTKLLLPILILMMCVSGCVSKEIIIPKEKEWVCVGLTIDGDFVYTTEKLTPDLNCDKALRFKGYNIQ